LFPLRRRQLEASTVVETVPASASWRKKKRVAVLTKPKRPSGPNTLLQK
jgi:hypothetical protein